LTNESPRLTEVFAAGLKAETAMLTASALKSGEMSGAWRGVMVPKLKFADL